MNLRIVISQLESELVDEGNLDGVDDLPEGDAPVRADLAHENGEASVSLLRWAHVEVREDGSGRLALSEHDGDGEFRGLGDLAEHARLVEEDDGREGVLAGDAEEGVAGLVEAVEGGGEGRWRDGFGAEEERGDDGEVGLDEGVGLDVAVRRDLFELELEVSFAKSKENPIELT